MKPLLVAALLALTPCAAKAAPFVTLGAQLSTPELFGVFASVWPDTGLSVDARLTLSSVDAGLTGHIPLAGGVGLDEWRHDLLITGYAGWVGIPAWRQPHDGWRLVAMGGYGLLGFLDIRLEAGVDVLPAWGAGFTAMAMVGKTF